MVSDGGNEFVAHKSNSAMLTNITTDFTEGHVGTLQHTLDRAELPWLDNDDGDPAWAAAGFVDPSHNVEQLDVHMLVAYMMTERLGISPEYFEEKGLILAPGPEQMVPAEGLPFQRFDDPIRLLLIRACSPELVRGGEIMVGPHEPGRVVAFEYSHVRRTAVCMRHGCGYSFEPMIEGSLTVRGFDVRPPPMLERSFLTRYARRMDAAALLAMLEAAVPAGGTFGLLLSGSYLTQLELNALDRSVVRAAEADGVYRARTVTVVPMPDGEVHAIADPVLPGARDAAPLAAWARELPAGVMMFDLDWGSAAQRDPVRMAAMFIRQ